ncbi:MAG: trimeric intracellular cation channel family protein [Clostridia bacterium]|nr:trimeric intracellular cation channel family protein [Clostridia bacterium]
MFLIFELIGTVAFAASGAITGISKKMDILGVATLGIVTAVGGGVIRDVILGITPPATFSNPIYAVISLAVSVIIFIPAVHKFLFKNHKAYDFIMLIMDSVGLGIFTVVGIQTAMHKFDSPNIFLLIFVGMVTGIGGGVVRDVLSKSTPYIFIKHFYACASFFGAVTCIVLWRFLGEQIAVIGGAFVVLILRLLAAHFRWSLPKAKFDSEEKNA